MSKLILTLIALGLLLFVGCSDDDTATGPGDETAAAGPILPLAVGNVWSGIQTTYYSGGTLSDTLMYYISDSAIVNNDIWYQMHIKRSGTHIPFGWLTYREDDGVYMASCDSSLGAGECEIFFKYPVLPGDLYETDIGGDDLLDTVYVASVEEKITVMGESHYCSHYLHWCYGTQQMRDYYLAPGLGFAQIVSWNGYVYIVWTLNTAILMGR